MYANVSENFRIISKRTHVLHGRLIKPKNIKRVHVLKTELKLALPIAVIIK